MQYEMHNFTRQDPSNLLEPAGLVLYMRQRLRISATRVSATDARLRLEDAGRAIREVRVGTPRGIKFASRRRTRSRRGSSRARQVCKRRLGVKGTRATRHRRRGLRLTGWIAGGDRTECSMVKWGMYHCRWDRLGRHLSAEIKGGASQAEVRRGGERTGRVKPAAASCPQE